MSAPPKKKQADPDQNNGLPTNHAFLKKHIDTETTEKGESAERKKPVRRKLRRISDIPLFLKRISIYYSNPSVIASRGSSACTFL